jgi:hypothetical protein
MKMEAICFSETSWRWRWYVPPKRVVLSGLRGMATAVTSSNPALYSLHHPCTKEVCIHFTWRDGAIALFCCVVLSYSLAIIRSVHKPLANIPMHLHVAAIWPPGRWMKWREHAAAEGTARRDFPTEQSGLEWTLHPRPDSVVFLRHSRQSWGEYPR